MINLLRSRRSIRKFKDEAVSDECQAQLKEALLRAPTSKNNRPCQFVFVDDKSRLEQLAACKPHGAAFLKEAPLGIVVLADPGVSDVWVEDCSIAAISVQYAAQELGLGSCWIQVRKRMFDASTEAQSRVREIVGIPEQYEVASIIAVGTPNQDRSPVALESLEFLKIKHNTLSDSQ